MENQAKSNDVVTPIERACIHAAQDMFRLIHFLDWGSFHTVWVELECGAVAVGRTYLLPPLSFGGALLVRPWLRFHIPLIEPDMQISRIRLSDKTSRLHPRHVVPKPA